MSKTLEEITQGALVQQLRSVDFDNHSGETIYETRQSDSLKLVPKDRKRIENAIEEERLWQDVVERKFGLLSNDVHFNLQGLLDGKFLDNGLLELDGEDSIAEEVTANLLESTARAYVQDNPEVIPDILEKEREIFFLQPPMPRKDGEPDEQRAAYMLSYHLLEYAENIKSALMPK